LIDEYSDVRESLVEIVQDCFDNASNLMLIDDSNQLATTSENSARILSTLNEKSLRNSSNLANNGLCSIEMSGYVKIYFEPLAKKYF
jgi:hypothetical protein